MHKSLPSFYRPDNRLDCPFPLAMIALSIRHNLIRFKRDREFFEHQYQAAKFHQQALRIKVDQLYPDGAPEPEYPSARNSRPLYQWVPGTPGFYFPPLIQSCLHETTADLKHHARVLFAEAMSAVALEQGISNRFDVFLVWHARVNSGEFVNQDHARASGILDVEREIIDGLIAGQTDAARNIAMVIAGAIEDLEREEAVEAA